MSSRPESRWIACALAAVVFLALVGAGCGDATEPHPTSESAGQAGAAESAAVKADRAEVRRERRRLRRQRAQLRRERAQIRRQRARAHRRAVARRAHKRELAEAAAAAAAAEPEPQPEPAAADCHPSYDPCLKPDSADYDCAGGEGDGPDYTGFVTVTGPDDYGLDSDGDGTGCES
jgi:hypothetical protein